MNQSNSVTNYSVLEIDHSNAILTLKDLYLDRLEVILQDAEGSRCFEIRQDEIPMIQSFLDAWISKRNKDKE